LRFATSTHRSGAAFRSRGPPHCGECITPCRLRSAGRIRTLHEFEIDDKIYAMFDLDDVLDSIDPDNTFDDRKIKLEKAASPGIKFVYKYDFAMAGSTTSSWKKSSSSKASRRA